jgi:hypothetical protein
MKKLLDFSKERYYSIKLWWYLRRQEQINNSIKAIAPDLNIVKENSLYLEGLTKLKRKVNQKAKTAAEYDATLKALDNMFDLAERYEDEEGQEMINNLYKVYIYKNEVPKEVMIDQRIKHYQELRAHKEKRQKLREQRKQNNGNL